MSVTNEILRGYMESMRREMHEVLSLNSVYSDMSWEHLPGNLIFQLLQRDVNTARGIIKDITKHPDQRHAVHRYISSWTMFRDFIQWNVSLASKDQQQREPLELLLRVEGHFWDAMSDLYDSGFQLKRFGVDESDLNRIVLFDKDYEFDQLLQKYPGLPMELSYEIDRVKEAVGMARQVLATITW